MIELTRFNGSTFTVNSDLIETVEATPDTVVSLLTGRKYIVLEGVKEVIDKIVQFRKLTGTSNILFKTLDSGKQAEE
ncbi:MAG TPA: flagellar FlbD family protein [Atribacteraceae bacterium]|nr:flagellar FlbD family protein [Atribacteraceae bacterium]